MNSNSDFVKPFFGSKKEGQGFADKRKKKAAYEYLKLLRKEKQQHNGQSLVQHRRLRFPHSSKGTPDKGKKPHAFTVAEKIAKKKKEEKEKRRQEMEKRKSEKSAAMTSYKEKKKRLHKMRCKKTSKGQPVMKYQMELLLEKIQKNKSSS
ncbi:thyroid transcription factor 1-associated protein 26 homolog [Biomphalaria glabrata]|uniref:Thyroid transcription factor 1-associated protein 26 homolog n=1 Tax=Biomphalaria glabrata TaxID=6526 RepID=A0A9W2ZBN3_BIOGL|nr:thyroid transcription factor 1-associated protein 26 homolog [Biomphalaria glabrata]